MIFVYILLALFIFQITIYIITHPPKNKENKKEYFNDNIYSQSDFLEKTNGSFEKKEILHSEFEKKLRQQIVQSKLKEKQRKEKNNKIFEYNLQHLKFITPKISNIKVSKKSLKNMPIIKFRNITTKTPFSTLDNFVSIDTETTGLRPSVDEIIEISAIKFINFEPTECLTTLIKPKKTIPNEIENINHISNEMVKNSPKIESVIQSFSDFIEDFNIVGYNLDFDISFLYKNGVDFFSNSRYFYDVLPICKKYLKNLNLLNYKLDTICNYLGIRKNNAHRATADALATGFIFRDIGHSIKAKTL